VFRPPVDVALRGGVEQLQCAERSNPSRFVQRIIGSSPTFQSGRGAWHVAVYNGGAMVQMRRFVVCAGN
jgi:hypothetical protein